MKCEYCTKPNLFNCLLVHKDKIPIKCLEVHEALR